MLFQLGWTLISILFWVFGSQRGLMALGLGSFGLAGGTGIFGLLTSALSYWIIPEVRELYLLPSLLPIAIYFTSN